MKYAIIRTGGKQYKVSPGDVLTVERLDGDKDQPLDFSEVLLLNNDGEIKIGTPYVAGVSVKGTVIDHIRGEKIRVAKFKAKSRYRKVIGHRQELTTVKIDSINDEKSKTPKIIQAQAFKKVKKNKSSLTSVKS